MRPLRFLLAWSLAAWAAALVPVRAADPDLPAAGAGPYTVSVERLARVLDLARPSDARSSLVVTLRVTARDPAALDRLVEVARDAAARDELLGVLKFRQIQPVPCPEGGLRRAEVVFSAASPMAANLRSLTASLVASKGQETVRLDAPAKPGGAAQDHQGGLRLVVDAVELGADERGSPAQIVRFTLQIAAQAADQPWLSEQILLNDDAGMAHAALSETRTYEYADEGQRLAAVKVTAFFAPLPEGRRLKGLRYVLDRAVGTEVFPYQFRNLPLP